MSVPVSIRRCASASRLPTAAHAPLMVLNRKRLSILTFSACGAGLGAVTSGELRNDVIGACVCLEACA